MVHGGCNILIGQHILRSFTYVKFSQRPGNSIVFKVSGQERHKVDHAPQNWLLNHKMSSLKLILMRNGSIIHNTN